MKANKEIVIGGIVALVLIGLLCWLLASTRAVAPTGTAGQATTSAPIASTTATTTLGTAPATVSVPTPVRTLTATAANPLPLDTRDTLTSWSFPVSASSAATAQVHESILSLSKDIGTGKYPAYDLDIQIAQEYELLGDGKDAYAFYTLAAKADPIKGLAFNDLGNLMARLGALNTARTAYAKSVALQPSVQLFWLSYLNFLTAYQKTNPANAAVFAAAVKATGAAPDVLIAKAQWEEALGNLAAAITDWQTVESQVSGAQQTAIKAKIAALQQQLQS